MEILLENIGKRYRRDWIFRKVNFKFENGGQYAVSGPNGSGKSTFLKVLSAHLTPSKGKITFRQNVPLPNDKVYESLAFAAPYIELLEEFTLREMIAFHLKFKSFRNNLTVEDLIERTGLQASEGKEIRFFSSGMKQRVKLVTAICSDAPLLLLDEPSTNLDRPGIDWYRQLMNEFVRDRTVIIASNVEEDFDFCQNRLNILDFK